jgi:hypothetical protein
MDGRGFLLTTLAGAVAAPVAKAQNSRLGNVTRVGVLIFTSRQSSSDPWDAFKRSANKNGSFSTWRIAHRSARLLHSFSSRSARCGSSDLAVQRDDPADFPDFVLLNRATGQEVWVEIVEAVESGELIAAERRAQRHYDAAAREYRARGEEVVLTVSPRGVGDVTPSPGFGVTGVIMPGPARRITPGEWIARALERKGRAGRYGAAERARTTLVIDCSREILVGSEDAADVRDGLEGKTLGFAEVWSVSTNWPLPGGLLLAPWRDERHGGESLPNNAPGLALLAPAGDRER